VSFDFQQAYDLAGEVPKGEIASYGMIASLLPGVTARMVARAFAGEQIERLTVERVKFRLNANVDWPYCLWSGPSARWIKKSGMDSIDVTEIISGWRRHLFLRFRYDRSD